MSNLHEEVVPGDDIKIGNQPIIRFKPLVVPENQVDVNFFVPYGGRK